MKNLVIGLCLLIAAPAAMSGCRETSKLPEPAIENLPLILPIQSTDTARQYLNLKSSRSNETGLPNIEPPNLPYRPTYEFTIAPTATDVKIRTVEVYKSYAIPLNALATAYKFGPRVKYRDFSSFPVTVTLNSNEALKGLSYIDGSGVTIPVVELLPDGTQNPNKFINFVDVKHAVVFTFEYILEDGRRIILTPLDSRGSILGTFALKPYAAYAVFRAPSPPKKK